ncbi:MAG: hypothetical protein C5S49_04105 [Candidatus Methanogaster sp.]|nr:MAG: hypothetical protein C5S49_04105 [ANME-2 cluster archaeon]
MRIIIEFDERSERVVQTVPELDTAEAKDAGAPSGDIIDLIWAETPELTPEVELTDVMDAGPPSPELVKAIQGDHLLRVEEADEEIDAGVAPSIEEFENAG